MLNERANGDAGAAAVAKRANDRHVRPAGHMNVLPSAGVGIAPCSAENAIQEALYDVGIAADRRATEAVTPPALVLQIEDGACRDDADAQGVIPAAASLRVVLSDHIVLACFGGCAVAVRRLTPFLGLLN